MDQLHLEVQIHTYIFCKHMKNNNVYLDFITVLCHYQTSTSGHLHHFPSATEHH